MAQQVVVEEERQLLDQVVLQDQVDLEVMV